MSFPGPRLRDLRETTLLVGSGLSGAEVNGLPAGGVLAKEIFSRLFSYSNRFDRDLFWDWGWTTPFEQILNEHPDPKNLEDVFRIYYSTDRLNQWQISLAECAHAGHVGAIITTNYDCCLEHALGGANVPFSTLVGPRDNIKPGSIPLFKVHGSVDRRDEPLVLSLRQEGILQEWKEATFRRLCSGKQIYVVGYSGRDFDICPVLFDTDYAWIHWLELPPKNGKLDTHSISAHLRFAVENPDRIPRFALVHGFFNDLLDVRKPIERATNASEIVNRIFEGEISDPEAYKLWAADMFQAISCRTAAEKILEHVHGHTPAYAARKLQLRSDMEERQGAYRTSAKTLQAVTAAWEIQNEWDGAVRSTILTAWRLITGAYLVGFLIAKVKASRYVARAKRDHASSLDAPLADARIAYLNILTWALMLYIPKGRKLFQHRFVRDRILAAAIPALETFRERGLWQEHYLISKQLQGFGLTAEGAGSHKLLPATLGFGQLGNLVGETSIYRQTRQRNAQRSKFLLDGLRLYGLHPEYWKFYYDVRNELVALPGNYHTAWDALRSYRQCQLSILSHFLNVYKVLRLLLEMKWPASLPPLSLLP